MSLYSTKLSRAATRFSWNEIRLRGGFLAQKQIFFSKEGGEGKGEKKCERDGQLLKIADKSFPQEEGRERPAV